jgi:hypothetical protein
MKIEKVGPNVYIKFAINNIKRELENDEKIK